MDTDIKIQISISIYYRFHATKQKIGKSTMKNLDG